MISIGETLVSTHLLERRFVCDLSKCKGACCVEGDSGAPLEPEEAKKLEGLYKKIEPYMTARGKKAVAHYGTSMTDSDGDLVTPLVDGDKECAYTIFEKGVAQCGIEKAYLEGKIRFRKPISCHLYPVRVTRHKHYLAVNYQKWDICDDACTLGKELDVPVYRFVSKALVRRFGKRWFRELEKVAEEYTKYKSGK